MRMHLFSSSDRWGKNLFRPIARTKKAAVIFCLTAVLLFSLVTPGQAQMQIKSGLLDYEDDLIKVSEGLTVFWQDYEIAAREGEINQEEEIARFFQQVSLTFAEGSVNSEEMTAHLQEDRFVFADNVRLNYQRNTEEDAEEGEPLELQAKNLEMFGDSGDFTARGSVNINYQGRQITAEEGDYRSEEEVLYLSGSVRMEEEDGDWITSNSAEVHLGAEDMFRAEGEVEIELDL